MKKIARITIGIAFIACGVGVFVFSASLLPHMTDWGKILTLLVPTVLFGIAIVSIGWGVIAGMKWQDVLESIMFMWH